MTIKLLEIHKLEKSPQNARMTASKAAAEDLKASIMAHGLMQNLVVVPAKKGKYHVIAGARRLAAMQELQAEGRLSADYAVPCQIVADDSALELSIAENTVRAAMHPADEFEAFAALVESGRTAAEVAERFGKNEKHVLQRLKLGRVAPELMAAYRADEIDLECLMAFTITDDQKKQIAVYRSLSGWQKGNARHIRGCLTEKMTDADDKLAKFVGLEAYEAAGGRVKADLFGDDVYLEDTALLQRLAGEKLEAEAENLRADGWGWVEVDFESSYGTLSKFGRLKPVTLDAPAELVAELKAAEAELEALEQEWDEVDADDEAAFDDVCQRKEAAEEKVGAVEAKLASFTDFDPEQKKSAGCFLSIAWRGELSIEKGLVKAEDARKGGKAEAGSGGEAKAANPGLSQSLIDDLKAYRTQVAQVEVAMNPGLAFDLLVITAARRILAERPSFDGANVSFQPNRMRPSGGEATLAAKRLEAIREGLPVAWLEERTEAAQLEAFQLLAEADKLRILAYCTAMTLQPKLAPEAGRQKTLYDAALAQAGVDVAAYWRPTAANFLSRLKSGQLLELGAEVLGEQWAAHRRNSKKAALVAELDKAFAEPEKHGKTPEQVERLRSWLPERMGLGSEQTQAASQAA